VNYTLSFLKGIALDYFELYLAYNPADKHAWASDYSVFTEELYRNFGPYDQVADAKIELENMVMKVIIKQLGSLSTCTDLHPCFSITIWLCIAECIWLC
jgi:hypothetical protein